MFVAGAIVGGFIAFFVAALADLSERIAADASPTDRNLVVPLRTAGRRTGPPSDAMPNSPPLRFIRDVSGRYPPRAPGVRGPFASRQIRDCRLRCPVGGRL
jgi:hypothetical protein